MIKKICILFFLGLFLYLPLISAPVEQSDDEMSEDVPPPEDTEVLKKVKISKTPQEIPADIPHELDVSYLGGGPKGESGSLSSNESYERAGGPCIDIDSWGWI